MADDVIVFTKCDLPLLAFPLMEDIRRRGKLCDVTLRVRQRHIASFNDVSASNKRLNWSPPYMQV
jgi:hypothetical protein